MPMMLKLTHDLMGGDISWGQWAIAMSVPGGLCVLLIPYLVWRIYPPELNTIDPSLLADAATGRSAPMSRQEKTLAGVFVLAILGWATSSLTHIDATATAVAMMALVLLCGVITWQQVLSCTGAWSTFFWYAGIISLADGLNKAGFFRWLGQLFQTHLHFEGWSPLAIMGCLILLTIVVRYLFASTIAFVVTFIPMIFTLGAAAKLPAIPLLLLCAASAQLASLMTHYGNAVGPVLFGAGYVDKPTWWRVGHIVTATTMVIYFVAGLLWWKLIGLW